MNITFGIITSGQNDELLRTVIESIQSQPIPEYEILIVGNTRMEARPFLRIIPFDESIKPNWITRKKNLICEEARYDIIVLLHDYVALSEGWYEGFLRFGNHFDICVTKIETIDGTRFRDYTLFPYDLGSPYEERALLPYTFKVTSTVNRLMYISGTYYIIKKHIALAYPLDERLCWGHGEDAELSKRLSDHGILLECNPYSKVRLLKHKYQSTSENEMTREELERLNSLSNQDVERMNQISKANIKNYIWNQAGISI